MDLENQTHHTHPKDLKSRRKEKILRLAYKERDKRKQERDQCDWLKRARPNQIEPVGEEWRFWLIMAGRGFGKTRTGAETIRSWVSRGLARRICLLGRTREDVRRIMIEGESGLLSVHSTKEAPHYSSSLNQLRWPCGALAIGYSADAPHQLRGPQFDSAWIDELAKFPYPQETWDQLMFALRLGKNPRAVITTTPRPITLLKNLSMRPDVVVTRGSTFDNSANLSIRYVEELKKHYSGTQLGEQEIEGKLVEHTQGALWKSGWISYAAPQEPLVRVVVAIDPAVTVGGKSDETGIVVASSVGEKFYILDDASGHFSPTQWIHTAATMFEKYHADRIVAEVNNGGDLVESLLRASYPSVPYRAVRATRGKYVRAEPIAALYEKGRVIHAQPFPLLEAQLLSYTPASSSSPDRLDALVWALTDLISHAPDRSMHVWSIQHNLI